MRGQRATGKIQRIITDTGVAGKTSSVSLMFTQGTHRNVKNR